MNKYLLPAVFLVAASLGAAWSQSAGTGAVQDIEREKAAVLKVEELVAHAQTPELGLSCYDPGAVQDDLFPPQRRGVREINDDFKVYMDNFTSFHVDIKDITIEVNGDLAVAYSHQHFTARGTHGNANLDALVRHTDVLRKKHGKWLITYQHLSVPIDILSGKALLKPAAEAE
jgi:ketosteroid isomerase-like protein